MTHNPMLPDLQKQFMDGILRKGIDIHAQLDSHNRDSLQQLNIYRNSYQGGLLKALIDIYPVSKRLLGTEFFDAMCLRYIKQTPCHSFDINKYGESFAYFAEQFEPVSELIYLPDVIHLEWAWHHAYQAVDRPQQDFTPLLRFTSVKLESLYLHLQPSMTLLVSPYPVDLIWSANQDDENHHQQTIDLDMGSRHLVIWRNGLDSHIDLVEPNFFEFLVLIQNNLILSDIQTRILNIEEQLASSLQRGYLADYNL